MFVKEKSIVVYTLLICSLFLHLKCKSQYFLPSAFDKVIKGKREIFRKFTLKTLEVFTFIDKDNFYYEYHYNNEVHISIGKMKNTSKELILYPNIGRAIKFIRENNLDTKIYKANDKIVLNWKYLIYRHQLFSKPCKNCKFIKWESRIIN